MNDAEIKQIYDKTFTNYNLAKQSLVVKTCESRFRMDSAISNVIPGYDSDKLKFGSYDKDKFAVVFVDIRDSTNRAMHLGAEKTFLSMHAFLTAMIAVVEFHNGYVVDIMGDGLMVLFGGRNAEPKLNEERTIQKAGLCGNDMIIVLEKVVNVILASDGIPWKIDCGVGVTYGDVIVTKIGTAGTYDVKAFGECINQASKFSSKSNRNSVRVSKYVRHHWPKGKGGTVSFSGNDQDGYLLTKK